ncbi:maltokinase N-terminal cap-like domain-containing protein [Cellulomonas sp. CW35]|uniref:maltokinase N-terminal cap-like domain-containing protein n=1 Tax=Cellulomonas sp. CW35 TaxID=3458249 RepID=UPI00403458DB
MLTAQTPTPADQRLLATIAADLPGRRWFPVKGASADLTVHAVIPLVDPQGAADVRVLLVAARTSGAGSLLQVPLVVVTGDDEAGTPLGDGRTVLDGAAHPAFLRAWFAVADGPGGAPAHVDLTHVQAITGEQSNSSVVLGAPDDPGRAILKVVRTLQHGENPDVEVPRALVEQGYTGVPAPLAWLRARWPDVATGEVGAGYLGVAAAFVAGARDGFELACELAGSGSPFAAHAHALGEATARMHAALASAFPTVADPDGPDRLARALLDRYAWARAATPAVEPYHAGVVRTADEVRALRSTPPRQRVHGDLHLGQVLHGPHGWLVLDFEGEPLAPLEARTRPDLAVRDVAGLLRSFDYAAAVGGATGDAAQRWVTAAREALLAGYAQASPPSSLEPGDAALLTRALELDKTLYEAVYEARNRPTWLPIPLAGLDRLAG